MRTLRTRLALGFTAGTAFVAFAFLGGVLTGVHEELQEDDREFTHLSGPDMKIDVSLTDAEVAHVMSEALRLGLCAGIPALVSAGLLGWWLAGRSLRPLRLVNQELDAIGAHTLSRRLGTKGNGTEEEELRAHINQLLERLDASFRQLREFSTHVAHELRSPLQVLRLQVEQCAPSLDPELAESLQGELSRLTAYIEQALLLARTEQGREQPTPIDVDLGLLLEGLADDYKAVLHDSGRRVLLRRLSPGAITVKADRCHLRRILHNLLSNAARHGSGAIEVRLRATTLTIANRLPPGGTPASAGTGIGLRLTQALVALQPGVDLHITRRNGWFIVRLRFRPASTTRHPIQG